MSELSLDWQDIILRSILSTAIVGLGILFSVITFGLFPIVLGIAVFFQYKRAKKRQAAGIAWWRT